jgi:hypothetical protein
MTTFDYLSHAAESSVMARTAVRITPTRRQIDNRFPVLGFTVDSGGRPFFEVLLATDRTLFDPANASRRTPASFYASREHSGLIRCGSEAAVYLVPGAVMQRFIGAREIFYTAAGYETAQGEAPSFALPAEQLAHQAPSISVSADFAGRTMASGFSVENLLRVRDDRPHTAALDTSAFVSDDNEAETESDRAGGEDGYGLSASAYDDGYGAMTRSYADDGDYDDEQQPEERRDVPEEQAASMAGYDDGYGDPIDAGAAALGSAYAPGVPAPAVLEDEDEQRREEDGTYPSEAAAYGDEAEQYQQPPYQPLAVPPAVAARNLRGSPAAQRRIIDAVVALDPQAGGFSTVIPSEEAVDTPEAGVSFGFVPFTQASGALGGVLRTMQQRDGARFQQVFGAHAQRLVQTTTAPRPDARMQAVGGDELWKQAWIDRFKAAGPHPAFQSAQNEAAALVFLHPMLGLARDLGLNSERALALLVNRAITEGVDEAWLSTLRAVSPIQAEAPRQQALLALGIVDLAAFQRAQGITPANGQWTADTHAAVIAGLRRLGVRSPVPVPTRDQMLQAMARASAGTRLGLRQEALRTSTTLTDQELDL